MRNVEIGPTSTQVHMKAPYYLNRLFLPRYRATADADTDNTELLFDGRDTATTMRDISDEIQTQMDFAFNFVMFGTTVDETSDDYETFVAAKDLFVSESGYPYAASVHGLFLNGDGASVFSYTMGTPRHPSSTAVIESMIHHI